MTTYQSPWGCRASIWIPVGLFLLGTLFEVLVGTPPPLIGFPVNLLIIIAFSVSVITIYCLTKRHPIVQWLTSLPAALSAIGYCGVMTIILGLIPQSNHLSSHFLLGLTHVLRSWQFLFAWLYLLTILTFVIVKRSVPLSCRNIRFLLSHLGLWLIMVAMTLGAGDKQKLDLVLHQGKLESSGVDINGTRRDLPFALRLSEFRIEEYAPKLLLVDTRTGRLLQDRSEGEIFISPGLKVKLHEYEISIGEFYPHAIPTDQGFVPSAEYGSVPAAFIEVLDKNGHQIVGWITCGNFQYPPIFLKLGQSVALVMERPAPQQFVSQITIIARDGTTATAILSVNHPIKVKNWRLYQSGYDTPKGRWSQLSIIQAVKDPWLPIVYSGLIMVLAGVGMLLFSSPNQSPKHS